MATNQTPKTLKLYKIVGNRGECVNGGQGKWDLPKKGKPGAWKSVTGRLSACANGLHLAAKSNLGEWYRDGRRVFLTEWEPIGRIDHGDKHVVRKARLIREVTDEVRMFLDYDTATSKAAHIASAISELDDDISFSRSQIADYAEYLASSKKGLTAELKERAKLSKQLSVARAKEKKPTKHKTPFVL